MKHQLSEVWIKASIAGTIWAAAEIVLGSFLHNLRVPFTGNILTAIGMIILISISYTWLDRGLFWRAGLICALMKTLSPSAVIFGPMIAIFTEGMLLEISTRLLGKTIPGYLVGAMVAMSWNLFQKIANYIIFYGQNIIEVYTNLLTMAQKQLRLETDIVWLPIIILLVVNVLFGLLAGLIGIRTGRKMVQQPARVKEGFPKTPASADSAPTIPAPETPGPATSVRETPGPATSVREAAPEPRPPFPWSLTWLTADLLGMISSFMLLAYSPWWVWIPFITFIVVVWSVRYKRAFRQLSKPKFWVFFVAITLLTAFVFTEAGPGGDTLAQGLMTGIQMNFRAVVIITGFSVLGTELYNPVIRDFFMRTSFKNLPLAMELSTESLPSFIAHIPDFKTLVRDPVSIFYRFLAHAEERLAEIRKMNGKHRQAFVITGGVGEGKTTFVRNLVKILQEKGINVAGILSERILYGRETIGYEVVSIETGRREVFLREEGDCGTDKIGRFSICPEGLHFGQSILQSLAVQNSGMAVIDEVGRLELRGGGWSENLDALLAHQGYPLMITVREELVSEVQRHWKIDDVVIFRIGETEVRQAGTAILHHLPKEEGIGQAR